MEINEDDKKIFMFKIIDDMLKGEIPTATDFIGADCMTGHEYAELIYEMQEKKSYISGYVFTKDGKGHPTIAFTNKSEMEVTVLGRKFHEDFVKKL